MTASRHAARPGDARSATLFLGEALPKYIRWAFLYPRPNIYMAGRTLPYPYLSASPDPLPRGSRGALVHPNGVYLHNDPQSRVKTAQAQGVGGHGALVHPNGVYLHNDPQSRVKTAQAKGVGGYGATLTKYLLQVESPGRPIRARLLLSYLSPHALP